MSMDTGLGSPRSSSGYGSSEEDHTAWAKGSSRRRRRKNLPGFALSAPQTPQSLSPPSETGSSLGSPFSVDLRPSETGSSGLGSPFSIDFRSVFDDATPPDFSDLDLAADDLALPAAADLMGAWTNRGFDVRPPPVPQPRATAAETGPGRDDDSHILVSLLKRPKAELDWITTGQQPPEQVVYVLLVLRIGLYSTHAQSWRI